MLFEIKENEHLKRNFWTELIKLRAGYSCERCGDAESRLDAHHSDGDNTNNTLANGQCLCISCHSSETMTRQHAQGKISTKFIVHDIRCNDDQRRVALAIGRKKRWER